jgi:hypothetical protein
MSEHTEHKRSTNASRAGAPTLFLLGVMLLSLGIATAQQNQAVSSIANRTRNSKLELEAAASARGQPLPSWLTGVLGLLASFGGRRDRLRLSGHGAVR